MLWSQPSCCNQVRSRWARTLPASLRVKSECCTLSQAEMGGIYQVPPIPPGYAMCSVWVFVKSGRVQMGVNSTNLGPVAWSEKHNEWEELRACTAYDYL